MRQCDANFGNGALACGRKLHDDAQTLLKSAAATAATTTIALQHLIFEGTLDRFPGLKIIAAHGGGYLPAYAARSDHACFVGAAFCSKDIALTRSTTSWKPPRSPTTRRLRSWAATPRSCLA
jgi:hypothetical protein